MKRFLAVLPAMLLRTGMARADAPGDSGYGYFGHPMMSDGGYGFGFMGVGMMVAFWGILIVLGYFALRWLIDRGQQANRPDALDILKERLARGEIDPGEYEARRKVLQG